MTVREDLVHDTVFSAPGSKVVISEVETEYVLDKVLEALGSQTVRQQVVLEIDPLENKMTVQSVNVALDAIIAVLGRGE